jgi:rRNA maturation endonuclease Nob1
MKIQCPHCGNTIEKKTTSREGMAMIMVQVDFTIRCPACQTAFDHYSAFGTEFELPEENILERKLG